MKKSKVIIQLKSKKSKVINCLKTKKSKEIRHFNVHRDYEKTGSQSRQLGLGFPFILMLIAFYKYFFHGTVIKADDIDSSLKSSAFNSVDIKDFEWCRFQTSLC